MTFQLAQVQSVEDLSRYFVRGSLQKLLDAWKSPLCASAHIAPFCFVLPPLPLGPPLTGRASIDGPT